MRGRLTVSQFFVYRRAIAWTLLVATLVWGIYAYHAMPQRHDPQIEVRSGVVLTIYPGASAVEVEQEPTRKVEKKLAENPAVEHVRSVSRQSLSVVFVDLFDTTKSAEPVWQDLDNKLAAMTDLPTAGGVPLRPRLNKDFGDTVAVMLTVSSPPVSDFEVEQRAAVIARRIASVRDSRAGGRRDRRVSGVLIHPSALDSTLVERLARSALHALGKAGVAEDGEYVGMLGAGVIDFRLPAGVDATRARQELRRWQDGAVGAGLGQPDIWPGVLVESPQDLARELRRHCQCEPGGVARYSYEELRRFADIIQDRLRHSPRVGKIEQLGVVDQAVYVYMSGRRVGSSALDLRSLAQRLAQRNLDVPGGSFELRGQSLTVKPSGKLAGAADPMDVVVSEREGYPVYLRDMAEVVRGYEDPPRELNFRTTKDDSGVLTTTRAITLAVRQVKGTQVHEFSRDVDGALKSLAGVLPDDLRVERTSDEPAQVELRIHEFEDCLLEAIVIVVVVAMVFMEWRCALIVAVSIPVTLAMTLGFCAALGNDLQQVSIAALVRARASG